jgi:hypothetical protein
VSRRGRIKSDSCFAGRTHTCAIGLLVVSLLSNNANSQTAGPTRPVSGVVMTGQGEVVPRGELVRPDDLFDICLTASHIDN